MATKPRRTNSKTHASPEPGEMVQHLPISLDDYEGEEGLLDREHEELDGGALRRSRTQPIEEC